MKHYTKWFVEGLKHYATFSGRAHRTAYWMFVLIAAVIGVVLSFVDVLGLGVLNSIFTLGIIIPSLAISVRRLHDVNRSGWWLLIGLIPVVGWIVLLVWAIRPSDVGNNSFGAPLPY